MIAADHKHPIHRNFSICMKILPESARCILCGRRTEPKSGPYPFYSSPDGTSGEVCEPCGQQFAPALMGIRKAALEGTRKAAGSPDDATPDVETASEDRSIQKEQHASPFDDKPAIDKPDHEDAVILKADLLAHYAWRSPKVFLQFDGFHPHTGSFGLDACDSDDDEIIGQETCELMQGANVRVLLDPNGNPAVAVRMLRKIANELELDEDPYRAGRSRAPFAPHQPPDAVIRATSLGFVNTVAAAEQAFWDAKQSVDELTPLPF